MVVYPTDTVYGVGADIFDEIAVKSVFIKKNRPFDMPLSVAVADVRMMESIAEINDVARKLIEEFLPGPLTLVVNKKDCVPDMVSAGTSSIGIRIPDNPISVGITKLAGPITSTSANVHSHPDSTTVEAAIGDLGGLIDLYIDAGPSKIKQHSTIVQIEDDGVKFMRHGAIPVHQIEAVLNA
ncbi:MAG: threonylcarbamoyl-AMP synthase [Candidatus Methanoplasma sp.]|nr:threonylcarbamoyl-AMP synthase [Candidatus Methanoplasma sp.]